MELYMEEYQNFKLDPQIFVHSFAGKVLCEVQLL